MKLSKRAQSALYRFTQAGEVAPKAVIAVVAYAAQNPGLEYGNYSSGWNDKAGRAAYFAESRQIAKDWRNVKAAVSPWHGVTDDDVIEAAQRAFSGRLSVKWEAVSINGVDMPCANCGVRPGKEHKRTCKGGNHLLTGRRIRIEYCTGQYWPTEYRKACAAVLDLAGNIAFARKQAAERQAA